MQSQETSVSIMVLRTVHSTELSWCHESRDRGWFGDIPIFATLIQQGETGDQTPEIDTSNADRLTPPMNFDQLSPIVVHWYHRHANMYSMCSLILVWSHFYHNLLAVLVLKRVSKVVAFIWPHRISQIKFQLHRFCTELWMNHWKKHHETNARASQLQKT